MFQLPQITGSDYLYEGEDLNGRDRQNWNSIPGANGWRRRYLYIFSRASGNLGLNLCRGEKAGEMGWDVVETDVDPLN